MSKRDFIAFQCLDGVDDVALAVRTWFVKCIVIQFSSVYRCKIMEMTFSCLMAVSTLIGK